jgi:DNA end-binding protein Ku
MLAGMAKKKSAKSQAAKTQAAKTQSARALWKGAISFGLVHVPVSMHPASRDSGLDFDWLDRRSMDPVGYKRVNKRTGKEITKEDIVRGISHEGDRYVVLSDEEIATAYPRSTRTIDIEAFVPREEIPLLYFERPYYLAPQANGAKVYALLREALRQSGRVGIARVVIQTKQHLAALVPVESALVLDLLRWEADIRASDGLGIPEAGAKAAQPGSKELQMAQQLVESMSGPFKPGDFTDSFKSQVMSLVAKKAKAGKTHAVITPEEEAPPASADIIDLTELLKRSLGGKAGPRSKAATRRRAA